MLPNALRARTAIQRRGLATVADAPVRKQRTGIKTGVVLARSPILTRDTTPFERAYYDYQQRLRRALSNPFPHEFYFKPGSLLEGKFVIEERQRENDLFLRRTSKGAMQEEIRQLNVASEAVEDDSEPQSRRSSADENKQERNLNRLGHRTLYLILRKRGQDVYTFPEDIVLEGELLHDAAARSLKATAGTDMDSWVVGRHPTGFHRESDQGGTRVFFFKCHILAGQAHPKSSKFSEFLWLAKEEVEGRVTKEYWASVRDMLS